jgi:hypothetical protein
MRRMKGCAGDIAQADADDGAWVPAHPFPSTADLAALHARTNWARFLWLASRVSVIPLLYCHSGFPDFRTNSEIPVCCFDNSIRTIRLNLDLKTVFGASKRAKNGMDLSFLLSSIDSQVGWSHS